MHKCCHPTLEVHTIEGSLLNTSLLYWTPKTITTTFGIDLDAEIHMVNMKLGK